MSRYLDPKADVVFKKVFAEHPHLLKSFLNAVLPLSDDQLIDSLEYLSPEQAPSIPIMKRTIADVKCTDKSGRVFIVEMQIEWVDSFKQRLLFESGQAYVKQLKKSEQYHLLKPVYGLGLIAVNFDPTPQWYHHYQLVNQGKEPQEIIEHLQLVFIELNKFPIKSPQEKKLRLLWLRFLREIDEQTKIVDQELQAVPEIKEALDLVEESAYTEPQLEAYNDYWKAVRTEKTLISGKMQEAEAEGLAKGFAKGLEEGLEQGLTEGLTKGKEEGIRLAQQEIAEKLLSQGFSREEVLAMTGISC